MSVDTVTLIAFLGSVVLIAAIWRASRRIQPPVASAPAPVAVKEARVIPPGEWLASAVGDLETAHRLLAEVYSIGLWSKSDDCSDNRKRREGLRETDWAVSGAQRAVAAVRAQLQDARLDALEDELRSLVTALEPLPDTVSDTMLETSALDAAISPLSDQIARLRERVSVLAAEYRAG